MRNSSVLHLSIFEDQQKTGDDLQIQTCAAVRRVLDVLQLHSVHPQRKDLEEGLDAYLAKLIKWN
jgi:hypothetical protein